MSTPAQHAANIQNSRQSTGPRTEQGKAASSQNARKHSLTSKQVVIKGESIEEFEDLKRSLYADHKPANTTEQLLVNEIAENYWRLMRARRAEAEYLDREFESAFTGDSTELDKIRRYMTSIERAWHRAIIQLEKTQSARIVKEEAERRQEETEIAALIERRNQEMHDYLMAPMPSAPSIGFVSQNGAPLQTLAQEPRRQEWSQPGTGQS
jgi:hypothetical protein